MMKNAIMVIALAGLFTLGCSPDKARACAGCEGTMLRDCEEAYEACDGIQHCRRTDIRRDYAEDRCLGEN